MIVNPRWGRQINYGFLAAIPALFATAAATTATVATTAAVVGTGLAIASAAGAFTPKASNINPNPTATPAQTVNPGGNNPSNPQQLGRAALIMTSPQGVQGSNPSNRYALLGNSTALS